MVEHEKGNRFHTEKTAAETIPNTTLPAAVQDNHSNWIIIGTRPVRGE